LRNRAFRVVVENYIDISKDPKISLAFYEDFLIKNIAFDTLLILTKLLSGHDDNKEKSGKEGKLNEGLVQKEKAILKPRTMNLRTALYNFSQKNLDSLKQKEIINQLPHSFLVELLENIAETRY